MPKPRKPANKVSKGRTPKPAANDIKSVTKSVLKGQIKDVQNRLSAVRNKLPVGANANNAVFNRGNMMGGTLKGRVGSGAVLQAASPFVDKFGIAMGKKIGNNVLKPVGRAIDKAMGTKPKKKGK